MHEVNDFDRKYFAIWRRSLMMKTVLGYILLIVGCKYGVAYALKYNDRGDIIASSAIAIQSERTVRLEYHNDHIRIIIYDHE